MNEVTSHQELLVRYLDGALDADEEARVVDLLRDNSAARVFLRELAEQTVVVADLTRIERQLERTALPKRTTRRRLLLRWGGVCGGAAAAIVAVIVSVWSLRPRSESEIVTIVGLNGAAKWTGDGGQVIHELVAGGRLSGGTLELLSADSWVEMEFLDGSSMALSGRSTVTISERQQKELHLRYGSLSASVRPQPTGHPMLVHTQVADLEVLGTQFNVDAQADKTKLTVNEGRVRLKRVTDGKELHVPAKHQAVASIGDQGGLTLSPRGEGVFTWQSDLKSDVVHGKWAPDLWNLGRQLKQAVAAGEMTREDAVTAYKDAATLDEERGSIWATPSVVGALAVLSVSENIAEPVVLASISTFRIQGRLHAPSDVVIGITTHVRGGGFAGKYTVSITAEALRGEGGAFDIEVPLSEFRPDGRGAVRTPAQKELTQWWCLAKSDQAKLEITGVELVE